MERNKQDLTTLPQGICPNCPYRINVPEGARGEVPICTLRVYEKQGLHGVVPIIASKGIPQDCSYLSSEAE